MEKPKAGYYCIKAFDDMSDATYKALMNAIRNLEQMGFEIDAINGQEVLNGYVYTFVYIPPWWRDIGEKCKYHKIPGFGVTPQDAYEAMISAVQDLVLVLQDNLINKLKELTAK